MDKQQERTKVYHGPDGWTILADRREVFPQDPGQGTPLMVYGPKHKSSGTLTRVLDTGEADTARGRLEQVPPQVMAWLEDQADGAANWVYGE